MIGITYPKIHCRDRGLWLVTEKSLGGPVRIVAAYGTSNPSIGRYFFRLLESKD